MKLKPKHTYFLLIAFSFILFTIIGTITHELGHWTAAKLLGYDATINYRSANYDDSEKLNQLYQLFSEKNLAEEQSIVFNKESEYRELKKEVDRNSFYFTLGGVLQTILFGTVAFIWLIYRRKKSTNPQLSFTDYIAIFFSLFWLREIFNPLISVVQGLFLSGSIYFGGDEPKLSKYLGLPEGAVSIFLAIIGGVICYYVIYKVLPKEKRSTFIDAGLVGGILGYLLWMRLLGPIVIP